MKGTEYYEYLWELKRYVPEYADVVIDEQYDWTTYKYCCGEISIQTKYCTEETFGTVDNKILLEPGDDIARLKGGVLGESSRPQNLTS